jgi:hypothetical protein
MSKPASCPLCAVLAQPVPLARLLMLTEPFCVIPCRCVATNHRVRVRHPHTRTGCAGYPWQSLTTEETSHGDFLLPIPGAPGVEPRGGDAHERVSS